jgi:hypothetical protein
MAAYISIENQTMLWSTIQKIQLLHENIPTKQQQDWFKNIIGLFYQQNINVKYDLRQLNKDTIGYMINTLKQYPEIETERLTDRLTDRLTERPTDRLTGIQIERQTEAQMERRFVERQQDYVKKEMQPSPNFKEALDDDVIENMDELLKQQLKQRELDVPIDSNIRKDIDELQKTVKLLQDEITELKKCRVEESYPT